MVEVTLDFLAQQQVRILKELGAIREEQANARANELVTSAIVQRMDATLSGAVNGLLIEVRALHGQVDRVLRRLERLEVTDG
jgi:hypothetical protein